MPGERQRLLSASAAAAASAAGAASRGEGAQLSSVSHNGEQDKEDKPESEADHQGEILCLAAEQNQCMLLPEIYLILS